MAAFRSKCRRAGFFFVLFFYQQKIVHKLYIIIVHLLGCLPLHECRDASDESTTLHPSVHAIVFKSLSHTHTHTHMRTQTHMHAHAHTGPVVDQTKSEPKRCFFGSGVGVGRALSRRQADNLTCWYLFRRSCHCCRPVIDSPGRQPSD